jgi:hypothetical protein
MAKVINITGTRCPPGTLARYDQWHRERHIPDMLKAFNRLRKATRYKLVGSAEVQEFGIKAPQQEYPAFITIYEFDNKKDFDDFNTDPALNACREDWARISDETGAEVVWRVQYEYIETIEQ